MGDRDLRGGGLAGRWTQPLLRRRIAYGRQSARDEPDALVFCSGGVGRHGPSEASLMADLLIQAGIDPARIALDEQSRDTMENVAAAAAFIRTEGLEGAVVCTDGYHVPRVRMLLRAAGVASRVGAVRKGYAGTRRHCLRMVAREVLAYPYDWALTRIAPRR
uniref:YdcF family protein n=1 Tax=Phenylobacterium glaciei TaxID=2803784 RepID=A0A974P7R3_9CAUL|nr:YdcF family protein [Phenylobacterium glaciei]